jgi:hypothetical protein
LVPGGGITRRRVWVKICYRADSEDITDQYELP